MIEGEIDWLGSVLGGERVEAAARALRKAAHDSSLTLMSPVFWAVGTRPL